MMTADWNALIDYLTAQQDRWHSYLYDLDHKDHWSEEDYKTSKEGMLMVRNIGVWIKQLQELPE